MAHLYYDENLAPETFKPGATITLVGDEARHAVNVARLRPGEQVLLGNGRGVIAVTQASDIVKGSTPAFSVVVSELAETRPGGIKTILVQALAQGDRDTRAVEQATEFGVTTVIPWAADRSVSVWQGATKQQKGQQKWQRIAREAAKQSLRAVIPEVMPLHTTADLVSLCGDAETLALVMDPRAEQRLSELLQQNAVAAGKNQQSGGGKAAESGSETAIATLIFIIGPEGGITDREVAALVAAGAKPVRLGETVLRTSSAGAAALAVANTAQELW